MLQIILATPSATSVHMIYINFSLPHLTRGNISLKIQMEVSSFVIDKNSHTQMSVPTVPKQKMIQSSAYGRNIRELRISQTVTLKADVRKEIIYSIRT